MALMLRAKSSIMGLALFPLAVALALAPLVPAQGEAPKAEALPAARGIIDRFCQETGLAQKLAATESAYLKGKASIPSSGLQGSFERWAAKPDLSLVRIELTGVGEILSGYDGKTAWSVHPMLGAQILKGAELLQARSQGAYGASLRPSADYESIETTARKPFAGEDCWEIRYVLAPLEDMDPDESRKYRTSYEYYAVESGRLLGMRTTSATQMGAMDVVVKYSKYARLGEVLQATVVTQEAAGNQLIVTLEALEYDQVKRERFALPAAIAAQLPAPTPPKPEDGDDGGGQR